MQTAMLTLLMAVPGQGNPYAQEMQAATQQGALTRRIYNRDQAVKRVPEALGFTQEYGDAGIAAILACSPETALGLVTMHETGALKSTLRPHALVGIVSRHGERVAAWVVENQIILSDPSAFCAFEKEPLEYVFGLKALKKGEPPIWRVYWREGAIGATTLLVVILVVLILQRMGQKRGIV